MVEILEGLIQSENKFSMETHRKHPLEKGSKYCVLDTFNSQNSSFKKGEIVIFDTSSYSIYDSSSCFIFDSIVTEEKKAFYLKDMGVRSLRLKR